MLGSILSAGATLAGGLLSRSGSRSAASSNAALQKEFAQHGIKWRVDDARRAGIHPLYALGANTTSFSPSYVGGDNYGLPAMGQDLSRAIDATKSIHQRKLDNQKIAYTQRMAELNVQGKELENDLLRSQIAKISQAGSRPPMPDAVRPHTASVDGQVPRGMEIVPSESIAAGQGDRSSEAGSRPVRKWVTTPTGGVQAMPSGDQELEGLRGVWWDLQHRLAPMWNNDPRIRPPMSLLRQMHPGARAWRYDGLQQTWMPVFGSKPKGRKSYGNSNRPLKWPGRR